MARAVAQAASPSAMCAPTRAGNSSRQISLSALRLRLCCPPSEGANLAASDSPVAPRPLRCLQLLGVCLELARKQTKHLAAQGGVVDVGAPALEQQREQVLPVTVARQELGQLYHNLRVALIEHRQELIADLALALATPAPARLEREDKEVLYARGVAACASLRAHFPDKLADARLVEAAHELVKEREHRIAQTVGRELSVPIFPQANTALVGRERRHLRGCLLHCQLHRASAEVS